MTEISADDFGDGFTWGVATAAYQIEGAWDADGKGPSVWDEFTHGRGPLGLRRIKDGATGDVATDSYHRFEEDIALVAAMGFSAYRFSISWPRVMPDGTGAVNAAGLDYYSRVVDACLAAGIEPWVTLYHWDLPAALERRGGWTNREIVGWFSDYVSVVVAALGDRVRQWMVFNEPLSFTMLGYLLGAHAPGRRGPAAFCAAAHHVNLATAEGARAARAASPRSDASIGTTQYLSPVLASGVGPLAGIAERSADALVNRLFLEPNLGLGYPWDDCGLLRGIKRHHRPGDDELATIDLDFLGVQYYTRLRAPWLPIPGIWTIPHFGQDRGCELTSMGWEVRPEGLGMVLDRVHAYGAYDRVVVTESGASFDEELVDGRVHDNRRIAYFQRHLAELRATIDRGVPVEGYFCWSLLDNFEWTFGYRPRFGLVHVDYATQQRIVKDSGRWFARLLGGRAADAASQG
ncbi:MAG: GH1 family beta-glucosidase [Microthrixaceae bacterium]|jgi:beta-glucosidase